MMIGIIKNTISGNIVTLYYRYINVVARNVINNETVVWDNSDELIIRIGVMSNMAFDAVTPHGVDCRLDAAYAIK